MSRMLKSIRFDLIACLALLFLPLWLFGDVTLGGKTMIPADNLFQYAPWSSYADQFDATTPQNALLSDLVLQNYPWKQFVRDSLAERELPLWSPHLFAGAPFLAKGQASVLYPFSILFYLLPLPAAYGWFTVLQLWLAGLSMYGFGRILKMKRASAVLSGIVYQGCGFMLVSAAVFPMILAAAVWLPMLLGVIDMIVRINRSSRGAGKTLPWAAFGALCLGCQLLAGHPEITYYTLLLMALYALFRLVTAGNGHEQRLAVRFVKPAVWLAGFVAIGLLLGAVQLLPLFEVGQTNFREASASLAEVRDWGFDPRRVLTLVMPNFFGNPAHHQFFDVFQRQTLPFTTNLYGQPNPHGAGSSNWGIKNYVEGGIYLGILPLILTLIALWRALRAKFDVYGRRAQVGYFTGLSLFSLAFIFGTPLYAILFYGLPFIDQLHSPFRWVFALSIAVAVLAGYGMDEVLQARAPRWLAGLTLLAGLATVGGTLGSWLAFGRIRSLLDRVFQSIAQAPDAFANVEQFYSYLFPQALTFGLMLMLAGGWLLRVSRQTGKLPTYWVILPLLLVTADLFVANRGFHAAVDPALLDFKPALVQWLEQQDGDWRFTSFESQGNKPFNANAGWLYGFEDVRGYDSIINKQYTDYMAAIDEQNELLFNRVAPLRNVESLNSPLLDLLGVKYIISDAPLDALPKLERVWEGEGVLVYENLAVMSRVTTLPVGQMVESADFLNTIQTVDPRTTLIFDAQPERLAVAGEAAAGNSAEIVSQTSRELVVRASVTEPSWLVVNDSYADGWRAYHLGDSGDQELPLNRANGNFRAVYLDEGSHTIRMVYSPRSVVVGALASFMGGIIVIFSFGVWGWRRFYQQEGELTNTQSIAKNSVVPMGLNLFNKAIDFAFAMFYLRVLGPAENGAYATAISIALWFDIVANWGLDALIIRDVAQDKANAGRYFFNTSLLRLFTTVLAVVPVLLLALFVNGGEAVTRDLLLALALICVGMIFSGFSKGLTGLFYAFESAEFPAAFATVATILKVALGVFVLLLGWGFVGLAGVSIFTNLVTLTLLGYLAWRMFPMQGATTVDWELQQQAFRVGFPLMLNHLLATVFFKIDQTLLFRLQSDEAVGWYNSAYKWVDAFNVIPSFFTFALFPIISRQVNSNVADARRTFRMSVKILLLIALPLAAVVTLLANFMIGTLGGAEFLPHGSIALRLVIWSIPIGWINSVTNYMIVSLGMEKELTWGFVGGVLFNTIGNLLLIPRFGYVAAAVTTILSELVLLVLFNLYLRRKMEAVNWLELVWRPVSVTAVMLGVLWLGAQLHLLVGLVAGLAVYAGGLLLLGVFGDDERRILAQILPQPLSRRLRLAV